MRLLIHTLTLVLILGLGFAAGARYQFVMDSQAGLERLVVAQKGKIGELEAETTHLATVVRLRELLQHNRVPLPTESVEGVARRIEAVSQRYAIPPNLIFAVIQTESSFNPRAMSNKGAMGLMQLLPATAHAVARDLNIQWTDDQILWDPETNIEMGTYYLRTLLSRFENLEVALEAYNHGPTRIATMQAAQSALPRKYSKKVLSARDEEALP